MQDRYGESGGPTELLEKFRLTGALIAQDIDRALQTATPRKVQ